MLDELDGAKVLKVAEVTPDVRVTGATRHYVEGVLFGPADALAIADAGEGGIYLFYLDAAAQAVTDTWHLSVEDALRQAEFEYNGLSWIDVAGA
jgi:hypothetical protein